MQIRNWIVLNNGMSTVFKTMTFFLRSTEINAAVCLFQSGDKQTAPQVIKQQ